MVKCCICWTEHCSSFPRQFHSFPINAERREQWFQSIGYTINAYKYARICSDHFKEDDYDNCDTPLQHITRRLKKTAIPSVFPKRFSHTIYPDKKSSIIEMQLNSTSSIQNNNQNDLMDIQQESMVIHKNVSIMDIKQEPTTTIIQHDISTDYESPFVMEEKNNTNRRRKQCNISKMTKMFVKTGKYNIECFKKTDFISTQSWIKFVRYVEYNRYVQKLLLSQKRRSEKNITTMKSIIQTLKHKN